MSAASSIILAVGVVWACLTAAVGAVAVSVFHYYFTKDVNILQGAV